MVKFPFGIFLTNICNCVLHLVIVRLEARSVWVRGNFDYESLFPGMTWKEMHGTAWDFSITHPSKWGALWHFEAYPCVSDPQSSQPEAMADHSSLWRRENVKFIKILTGETGWRGFHVCVMWSHWAFPGGLFCPTLSAAEVPHLNCNRKIYRCRIGFVYVCQVVVVNADLEVKRGRETHQNV